MTQACEFYTLYSAHQMARRAGVLSALEHGFQQRYDGIKRAKKLNSQQAERAQTVSYDAKQPTISLKQAIGLAELGFTPASRKVTRKTHLDAIKVLLEQSRRLRSQAVGHDAKQLREQARCMKKLANKLGGAHMAQQLERALHGDPNKPSNVITLQGINAHQHDQIMRAGSVLKRIEESNRSFTIKTDALSNLFRRGSLSRQQEITCREYQKLCFTASSTVSITGQMRERVDGTTGVGAPLDHVISAKNRIAKIKGLAFKKYNQNGVRALDWIESNNHDMQRPLYALGVAMGSKSSHRKAQTQYALKRLLTLIADIGAWLQERNKSYD